jgi:hypothetical protein
MLCDNVTFLLQGPLSPQSTLHATVASGSAVPTAVDVVSQPLLPAGMIGIDGVGVLPPDQPIIVQPLAVLGPVQQVGVFIMYCIWSFGWLKD